MLIINPATSLDVAGFFFEGSNVKDYTSLTQGLSPQFLVPSQIDFGFEINEDQV